MRLKTKRALVAAGSIAVVAGGAIGVYQQQKQKAHELYLHQIFLRRLITGDEEVQEYAKSKFVYVPVHGPGLGYLQGKLDILSPARLLLQARDYTTNKERLSELNDDSYTASLLARQRLIDEALNSPLFYQWSAAGAVQIAKNDPFIFLGLLRSGGWKLNDLLPFAGPPKFTFYLHDSHLTVMPSAKNALRLRAQFGEILEQVAQPLLPRGHAAFRIRALKSLKKVAKKTKKTIDGKSNKLSEKPVQQSDAHDQQNSSAKSDSKVKHATLELDIGEEGYLADYTFAKLQPPDAAFMLIVDAIARCSEISEIAAHFPHTSLVFLLDALLATHQLSPETQRNIAKLIGNIACYMIGNEQQFVSDVLRSRIIAFLVHAVLETRDVELSLRASKALANLDCLNWDGAAYAHGIYLLHPLSRVPPESIVADVVFVHGLKGGALKTWRQNDITLEKPKGNYTRCWPRDWLPVDVPNIRVIAVDFESTFTGKDHLYPELVDAKNPTTTIEARATEFLYKLQLAGIGDRPIIWCTHSMGGLIVKQLLVAAAKLPESPIINILQQTKGIVFYSTPHLGSPIATGFVRAYAPVSREVVDLCENSDYLLKLHRDFMQIYDNQGIKLLSFCEGKLDDAERSLWRAYQSFLGAVAYVPLSSANPMSGDFILLPDELHFSSCKPKSKESVCYAEFVKFIQALVKELAPKNLGETVAQEQVESQRGLAWVDEAPYGVDFAAEYF